MRYDPKIHHRRSIRLRGWDYGKAGWYYVTVCARGRVCSLGEIKSGQVVLSVFGQIVDDSWRWLAAQYPNVEIDNYVIMPNHLHGIIIRNQPACRGGSRTAPTGQGVRPKALGRLIGAFKTVSTKRINLLRNSMGEVFWQRDYYEHIIRDEADLHRIHTYIVNNPVQWSLDEENPDNIA